MKIYNRIALIILFAAVIPLIATSAESRGIRRFAVIAGANNGGPDRVLLKYAVSDADTMMDVMKRIGGVSDSDGTLLINPDRRNLISALSRVKNEIITGRQKNERIEFIFYYSGHSDEEAILLGREKVTYKELKDGIKSIPADVRIAILDSCSSGAFTRIKGGTFRPPFVLDSSFNMKGDAFMTSSSANEASQESDAIRGSFFTYYLVSGLRGAADMIQDGRITLNEAYQYAYNETLARTEKTIGGTQHPNYDIQMTGTGDVVITDIKRRTSGLTIEKKVAGRISIRNSDNVLVAEVEKPYGRELDVALPEGRYTIINRSDDRLFEGKVDIPAGERYLLAQKNMTQSDKESTIFRGKSEEQAADRKKVLFDSDSITHGGQISAINHVSYINGNWSNLTGGKITWIINHKLSIGGEGFGFTYPTDREKFTGKPYSGTESKVGLGYGGPYLEYFFWPENIFTIAPGLMVGAGGFGYYNTNDSDETADSKSSSDVFLIVTPEVNIFLNITKYIRIGAGVSYRFVNGLDTEGFTDRDFRGFSMSLSISAGFF